MKKLSVLLLAIVFIFGLATQAGAAVTEVEVEAFAADQPITFSEDDVELPQFEAVTIEYESYNVVFAEENTDGGWRFNANLSNAYGMPYAVGNIALTPSLHTTQVPLRMEFVEPVTRVGFDVGSIFGDPIIVTVYRDGSEQGTFYHYSNWDDKNWTWLNRFFGVEDLDGIDAIEISAEADVPGYPTLANNFFIDNLRIGGTPETGPTEIEVTMNVNPPSCSGASINVKSKGKIPVVIVGSADFDVTMIDPDSIKLNGVAPVRSAIEDVPYCNNLDPDGFLDLTLKFNTQELVEALTASLAAEGVTLENDDWPSLQLTGSLLDETAIYADEPVCVKGKPAEENQSKGKKRSSKSHSRHDRGHHKGWDNHR